MKKSKHVSLFRCEMENTFYAFSSFRKLGATVFIYFVRLPPPTTLSFCLTFLRLTSLLGVKVSPSSSLPALNSDLSIAKHCTSLPQLQICPSKASLPPPSWLPRSRFTNQAIAARS
ncbi:unnamed protein product [Cuscuta epithymum]|uniref:Uncharacterized protein n=1 Tax=Cuscuta epithymum TaxID=186058 RepID=A0AAV0D167_9ASTE|nr:unnamed protein product [Cuscuta epithymum]